MLRFRRRELQHREWMAALEKGVPLPDLNALERGMGGPRTHLLRGLIWLACGVTLILFLWGVWATAPEQRPTDAYVRQARDLREGGYSAEEIRRILGAYPTARPTFPLGLSLIGLVPAGIGVAYLVFYRMEDRRPRHG
jgi:hypothetical protein